MPSFREWLARLFDHGESVQDTPPELPAAERAGVLVDLRAAFDRRALDVAGPPITFNPNAAAEAAVVLARACWAVAAGDDDRPVLEVRTEPATPSAHLSVDVTFRFLPVVYRRAKARSPDGPLTAELDRLLRAWPLSGVLADLDGGPTISPDFGHPGLQLLYAERLVTTGRPGWVPQSGPAREWAERVYHERSRPVPTPPPQEPAP